MQLHVIPGSPNCHKVEATIRHLGLTVEIERHDPRTGTLATPEFLALNPNAMAPVLVDGPFALWESNAILQYLADRAGDEALFPREPRMRADVVRWLSWEIAHFNRAFGTIAFEAVAKPKLGLGPTDQVQVDWALGELARFAPVLERHMTGRGFAVGDGVTIADYALAKLEAYRDPMPFDWSPYPSINAYFDRVHALEHWVATAPRPVAAAA